MSAVKNSAASEIELTKNVADVEVNGKSDDDEEIKNNNILQKVGVNLTEILRLITVEFYLICYLVSNEIMSYTLKKFKWEVVCRTTNFTNNCDEHNVGDKFLYQVFVAHPIDDVMSNIAAWSDPIVTFVPAILMLNIGAWSDRTGHRKILMLVSIFGEFLTSILYLMGTYYLKYNWTILVMSTIETIIRALTGGLNLSKYGIFIYLADVTKKESLTLKIGITLIITNLLTPLCKLIAQTSRETMGYYELFGLTAGLNIIGFCYVLFRIKDANRLEEEMGFAQKVKIFVHPINFWHTFSILFQPKGRRLVQILLIICSFIFFTGSIYDGKFDFSFDHAVRQYKADSSTIQLQSSIAIFAGFLGSSIAVMFLSRMLRVHDSILAMIGLCFNIFELLIFGFATNSYWLYASALCSLCGKITTIAISSLVGKIGKPENIGKLMSIIYLLDAIIPTVAEPIYNKIYESTMDTFPEAIYTVQAVSLMPNFFIFIALFILHKKDCRDATMNSTAREIFEHNLSIEVTRL